jgi:hypothetical protein
MQGKKTHEQHLRILERKPDTPDARELDHALQSRDDAARRAGGSSAEGGSEPRPSGGTPMR